ncbi:hypothetical protein [Microbulbifer sp. ZKSA002]
MMIFCVEIPSVSWKWIDDFAAKIGYALHTSLLPVGRVNNRGF